MTSQQSVHDFTILAFLAVSVGLAGLATFRRGDGKGVTMHIVYGIILVVVATLLALTAVVFLIVGLTLRSVGH